MAELAPEISFPLRFHWYPGVAPPFVMELLNCIPRVQILVCELLILILGVTTGVTVMLMELLVAVVGEAQANELVITV